MSHTDNYKSLLMNDDDIEDIETRLYNQASIDL